MAKNGVTLPWCQRRATWVGIQCWTKLWMLYSGNVICSCRIKTAHHTVQKKVLDWQGMVKIKQKNIKHLINNTSLVIMLFCKVANYSSMRLIQAFLLTLCCTSWKISHCMHTFNMRTIVLRAIIVIMKNSKGPDTTRRQTWYLKEFLFFGMNRDIGLALMAKSMHCFWKKIWQ